MKSNSVIDSPYQMCVCVCVCVYLGCVCVCIWADRLPEIPTAQEWRNCTLIGNGPLIYSKMCFTKTELVQ